VTVKTWKRRILEADGIAIRANTKDGILEVILCAKDGKPFAAGSFNVESAGLFLRDIAVAVDLLRRKDIDLQ
jgi:hypothetical protein